jgi:hypothetical protein
MVVDYAVNDTNTRVGILNRVEACLEVNASSTTHSTIDPILLATQVCRFTKLLEQVQAEVIPLSSRVSRVESENLSLIKLLNETKCRIPDNHQMTLYMQKFSISKINKRNPKPTSHF